MSKAYSLILLVFFCIIGSGVVALADVTGSLDVRLLMVPEGIQTEAQTMNIDLQSNLVLNVTLSGLTLGMDVGFGTNGIEFAIINFAMTLGALDAFSQMAFATPFYNTSADNVILPTELHPTTHGSTGQQNGPAFVRQRLELGINIAGVNLNVLTVFEDVDFPNPLIYKNPVYNVDEFDSLVDVGGTGAVNQTPSYGFGSILEVSGQTLSGINISGRTGLCTGVNRKVIKKREWPESVNQGCAAEDFASEGVAKSPVLFDFESLMLENIPLGPIMLDTEVFWRPLEPVQATTRVVTEAFDFADITLSLKSDNLSNLSINQLVLDVAQGGVALTLIDNNVDLMFDTVEAAINVVLNPNQNPASLTLISRIESGVGLSDLDAFFTVSRGPFLFQAEGEWTQTGPGQLTLDTVAFNLSASFGSTHINQSLLFAPTGMLVTLEFGVLF